jgi:phosphatidylserine/phosphatidylglycerophosphate/cardiolipin synthase-like enzyme
MRLRQWVLSLSFFLISVLFLLYSKTLFHARSDRSADPLNAMETIDCQAHLLPNQDYYPYLKAYFQRAQKSIVGTVYLVKTADFPDNEPADLLRELMAASRRNVQVDLVLERSEEFRDINDSNSIAAETLRKAGVHVRFDPVNMATHAKTFVIDGRFCFVGSHNLTHAAMTRNAELSVFIDSTEMAQKITDFVQQIPKGQ